MTAEDIYCKHCERPRAVCPVAQAAEAQRWLENRERARARLFSFGEVGKAVGGSRETYLPR